MAEVVALGEALAEIILMLEQAGILLDVPGDFAGLSPSGAPGLWRTFGPEQATHGGEGK